MITVTPSRTERKMAVEAAVAKIRAFHRLGRSLPPRRSRKEEYGEGVVGEVAKQQGIKPGTLRKAQAFADAHVGYSEGELDDLCRFIEHKQGKQKKGRPIFSITHLVRLLSVPKAERAALTRQTITKAWSLSGLGAELAARYGTRKDGGRRREVPQDVLGLLVQLELQCESWRRWVSAVTTPTVAKGKARPSAAIDNLSATVQRRVHEASRAINRAHREVVAELLQRDSKRAVRKPFRPQTAETVDGR